MRRRTRRAAHNAPRPREPFVSHTTNVTAPLKQFFYHSRLAPGHSYAAVSNIIATARSFNAAHGITGILVFDGHRFCQFIEGPPDDIDGLVKRLQADPRHMAFTALISDVFAHDRFYPYWSMAYAALEGGNYLNDLLSRSAEEALQHLQDSIDQLDVN